MNIKVRINNQVFVVEVGNTSERPILATVDGENYEVWPETNSSYTSSQTNQLKTLSPQPVQVSILQSQPRAPSPTPGETSGKNKSVRAPIPGVITSINVQAGGEVSVGQELCKLEAMKMNNSIRANHAGTIETIHISIGQHVKHNDVLIDFAE